MTHDEVYKSFRKHLTNYAHSVKEWFPNGKDSIRVRFNDDREYIYTITNQGFRFESKEHFVEELKGDLKMRC